MAKSIYFINPRSDFPTYFSAEVYESRGLSPTTLMGDLAIPTLAALAKRNLDVQLCDENISAVNFDTGADFIAITGKVTQHGRMAAIAKEFRRRKKTVLIGGPHASLSPERLRPLCDILVKGEIEDIADDLFSDLQNGCWKDEYVGGKPSLTHSPIPDWKAYPNNRAVLGTVQTSRGCPFECEFCDVIQYLGRNQRHKPPANVLAELEELYDLSYRRIFLADDNFTVYKSRAKELLVALREWNHSRDQKMSFTTQVSIECSKDSEMLQMCAEAGLNHVFIGIETPNESSLKETKKRQNLHLDLGEQIKQFLGHGIAVTAGMIVGFDADGKDIFQRQYEFAMSTPIPIFSVGALVAPAATPLHARMAQENRLIEDENEAAASPWSTNLIPRQMTREELLLGVRWLCSRLYSPHAFGERMLRFIESMETKRSGPAEVPVRPGKFRSVDSESFDMAGQVACIGPGEAAMFSTIRQAVSRKKDTSTFVLAMLAQYMQVRFMLGKGGVWSRDLASKESVPWEDISWRRAPLSQSYFASVG